MSYDINAIDKNGDVVMVEHHNITGGTYALGGTEEATFNITFNYSEFYSRLLPEGIRFFQNMLVIKSIKHLNDTIKQLKGESTDYYWDATEGNAKLALINLRELALLVLKVNTEAKWQILF